MLIQSAEYIFQEVLKISTRDIIGETISNKKSISQDFFFFFFFIPLEHFVP